MQVTQLTPLTEILTKDESRWKMIKRIDCENSKFYVHLESAILSCHIDNLSKFDHAYLNSLCHSFSIANKHITSINFPESFPDETTLDHLKRLKIFYKKHISEYYEVDFHSQFIQIDSREIVNYFLNKNKTFIPANTTAALKYRDTFYGKDRYYLVGSPKEDIHFEQVFILNDAILKETKSSPNQEATYIDSSSKKWSISSDYSKVIGPNCNISTKNDTARKILKACIELNNESNGEYFKNADVFHRAEVDSYERKLGRFLRYNPYLKEVLEYIEESKVYKLNIPVGLTP